MANKISEQAARDNLRNFFSRNPSDNTISVNEIFVATGRAHLDDELNRSWLSNKLTPLRQYNLVNTIYSHDGKKGLDKIQLTVQGKRALGRISDHPALELDATLHKQNISIAQVQEAVRALRKKYPEFEVVFTMKLREQEEEQR